MKWNCPPIDAARAASLSRELDVSLTLARVLLRRGIDSPVAARLFLDPRPEDLHDPARMRDMDKAVERIGRALRGKEKVMIFGDYDVDGLTSLAALAEVFAAAGLPVIAHQPHRLREGYGLNPSAVRLALRSRASLLVALDCGTEAHEAVSAASSSGLDVVVVDHHRPRGPLPPAFAVLNPRREDCPYPFKELAAAGVVFKLLQAGWKSWGVELPWERLWQLAALGTVADVVPLRGENRVLVRTGLKGFRNGKDPVFRALGRIARLEPEQMTARSLAFMIAPRLNAVGRLGEAELGRDLLLARDREDIDRLVRAADRLNSARRALEKEVFDQADGMIGDQPGKYLRSAVVIAGEDWSRGVVGIVAARLCEKYRRPAVVISLEGEEGTGSGRSVPGFDLFSALAGCSDCLVKFGGHKQAAGVSLKRERVDDFREALGRLAERELGPDGAVPELEIDSELGLEEADCRLAGELEALEPCGQGNPPPVFITTGLEIIGKPKIIGRECQHLKIRMGRNGTVRDFLGWGMAGRAGELAAGRFDAAYQLRKGSWRGEEQADLILKDLRPG